MTLNVDISDAIAISAMLAAVMCASLFVLAVFGCSKGVKQ